MGKGGRSTGHCVHKNILTVFLSTCMCLSFNIKHSEDVFMYMCFSFNMCIIYFPQMRCPEISKYFEGFKNGRYVPKPWLQNRYPRD